MRVPVDWDPLYYRSVARHIAQGDGAVSGALWTLGWLPASLPFPADVHWMPLPSRVLVPGVWAWPAHGDQVVTVALAALWAPLAWALCREGGGGRDAAWMAGLMGLAGGGYARFLSTPDSIALYGVIGSVALLALARGRPGWVVAAAAAAALTRGDGFLLGPCLALGLWASGRRLGAVAAAVAGFAAAGAWQLRNLLRVGEGALEARRVTAHALDYGSFILGEVEPIGIMERLGALGAESGALLQLLALVGVFLLPWPAVWAAWRWRDTPWVRAASAYLLLMPPAVVLLAPAVGGSGTVFRSGAALFPAVCALGALGVEALGSWTAEVRGYPRRFVPGLVLVGFWVGSMGLARANTQARPIPPSPCAALAGLPPDAVVFAGDPLRVEGVCGRPAVMLPRGIPAARAAALAQRYGVRAALPGEPEPGSVAATSEEAARVLEGWQADARGVLHAPP